MACGLHHFGKCGVRHVPIATVSQVGITLRPATHVNIATYWDLQLIKLCDRETATLEIAAVLNIEKDALKRKIRKLKELGLTESLHRGYGISARGKAVLEVLGDSGDRSDATP